MKNAPLRKRTTRAELKARTRAALIDSATRVVGEFGYSGALVTAITRGANVAQGTFYNYFESREDILDQLLPALARRMFEKIQIAAEGAPSDELREEASMRAYFEFFQQEPDFYRILYEAETFAPAAFRAHVDTVALNYARVLHRARTRGEVTAFTKREIDSVVFMLMGIRHYLSMRHSRKGRRDRPMPEWITKAYMKLIRGLYLP